MNKVFGDYGFLTKYLDKKIESIQTVPHWPDNGSDNVSDEVVINFISGEQLVVKAGDGEVEMPFGSEEDSSFDVYESVNHVAFCNLDGLEMTSILVDEKPESLRMLFDEVDISSGENQRTHMSFPIAIFIQTKTRSIAIWKDSMEGAWLHANFNDASISDVFPVEERWGGYDALEISVMREAYDYRSSKKNIEEERVFQLVKTI